MKKIVLALSGALLFTGLSAQQPAHNEHDGHDHSKHDQAAKPAVAAAAKPAEDVLQLKELEFDFGKIPQGKPVYHVFVIQNTGKAPLVLDNVQASCGCTTPEWSHEPIAPGAKAEIKVGYNAAAEGPFTKPVTITYNSTQSKQLMIKGTVWKAPEGSAPANAPVEILKKQTF
jgi:hypothetical protein